jgi:hypothetical protein
MLHVTSNSDGLFLRDKISLKKNIMKDISIPRTYPNWRKDKSEHEEDAAYTFGYHLIKHCRTEAVKVLPTDLTAEQKEKAINAIDISLHNVMDLLEGFWQLDAGENHRINYALHLVVKDDSDNEVERIAISPAKLDLPIGYWKWVDNEFQ